MFIAEDACSHKPGSVFGPRGLSRLYDPAPSDRERVSIVSISCELMADFSHSGVETVSTSRNEKILAVLAQGRMAAQFRRDEIELDELTDLVARVA